MSGSGKTTYSTEFIKNSTDYIRCNRDDIRRTLMGDLVHYYGRRDLGNFEKMVTNIEYFIWETAIRNKKSVIIDNTNLKLHTINSIIKYFYSSNYTIQFKLFDCELIESKARVYQRDYLSTNNPSKVDYIDKQYKQYQSIKKWVLETYPNNIIT
jgi:predicted kinase